MSQNIHKFGRNPAVANGAWEDIWETGGTMLWPTAAQTLKVQSSTAADTSDGAGARSITVIGLSSSFEPLQETINTAGTSTGTGLKKFVRVDRAFVEDAGAYGGLFTGGNRGSITVNTSTGGAMATISATTGGGTVGEGQTQLARFTIPADHVGYVPSVHLSVDANKPADIIFWQRQEADVVSAPFKSQRVILDFDVVVGAEDFQPRTPLGPFPHHTDLWFSAKGEGNATEVDVDFEIMLFHSGHEQGFS